MKRYIFNLIRTILLIGMSIQLAIGSIWLFTNFFEFQEFGDSYLYIEASKTLFSNTDTGLLYPFLILLSRGLGAFLHVTWYYPLYLLQLWVGYISCKTLTFAICDVFHIEVSKWWKGWGTLCIMSVPMVLQCYLAVLPNSLTVSCYILMLSICIRIWNHKKETDIYELAKLGVLWLLCGLFMTEYVILGGILVLVILVRNVQGFRQVLLIFCFAGMTIVLSGLGRTEESLPLKAVSRFVWPDLQEHYVSWPSEIHGIISWEQAGELSQTADSVFKAFAFRCEEVLGADKAKEVYVQMAGTAIDIRSREIAERILWDIGAYVATPGVLLRQLDGQGYEALSGRNYEIMKAHTPAITKIYVYYSGRWFMTAFILATVLAIVGFGKKGQSTRWLKLFVSLNLFFMVIYYTMQGTGLMDYKKTLPVMVLWALWIVKSVWVKERIGEASEE